MNIALLIIFSSYIELNILSALPVFLIALMFFQSTLFKNTNNDTAGDTAYSVGNTVRLTEKEQTCQYSYLKHSFLFCIPFEIPLIFFLPSYWKLIGIVPYFLSYVIGGVVFKIRHKKAIQERINREKKELEEQLTREELGLK